MGSDRVFLTAPVRPHDAIEHSLEPSFAMSFLTRARDRLERGLYAKGWNAAAVSAGEAGKFGRCGLDYEGSYDRLNDVLKAGGKRPFDHRSGTDSVHWLLFAAISLSGRPIRRILEIGTFRGKTAWLLARLFSQASITTVDLPEHDPILRATYGREKGEAYREYLEKRAEHLADPRIELIELNSFFLPEKVSPGFDLLWMDGGHNWPEVGWDLCNAWHLARSGGIIMCDDVMTDPRAGDSFGRDQSHRAIAYLADRAGIEPVYFLKRENPAWSAMPHKRKFVAYFEKP